MHITKWKKPHNVEFQPSGNGMGPAKRLVVVRGRNLREGWIPKDPQDFQGSERILYNAIMLDMGHYTFVQTHRMENTKSKP